MEFRVQRYGIILMYQNKNQIIFAYLSIFIQNIGLPGFHAQFFTTQRKIFFISTENVFHGKGGGGHI